MPISNKGIFLYIFIIRLMYLLPEIISGRAFKKSPMLNIPVTTIAAVHTMRLSSNQFVNIARKIVTITSGYINIKAGIE